MDLMKKKAEEEEQERQKILAEKAQKKVEIEETQREGQIIASANCIHTFNKWVLSRIEKNKLLQDWQNFVACRNVPNFLHLNEVNAYLEYWKCQLEKPDMKTLLKLAPEMLVVVDELKEFLEASNESCDMELGLLYHDFMVYQQRYLDKCTYAILKDLSPLYDPEVGILDYFLSIPQLTHCLWGNIYQCPNYDGHNFQEVHFQFKRPETLITVKGIYRLIKAEYDHYSTSCNSYFPPGVDNGLKRSIRDWIETYDQDTVRAKAEAEASKLDEEKSKTKSGKKGEAKNNGEGRSTERSNDEVVDDKSDKNGKNDENETDDKKERSRSRERSKDKKGEKGKTQNRERPKTEAELRKERERAEKAKCTPTLQDGELNLRMYHILGGTYSFQLLDIPPQPVNRGKWTIQLKEYDCSLKEVPFVADFVAPDPTALDGGAKKTPEEMEREAKKQEDELQKLVLGNMVVPKSALWFEPPIPVRWDAKKRFWSEENFNDIKFDERSLHLSFRTTKFGVFGLGHNRWLNLPYQSWELRPMGKNKVFFALTASMAILEFIIQGALVCVSNIDNVTNAEEVQEAVLNKFMRPSALIKQLRSHNLDVFPEMDSYAYVDGILTKHYETEDHLYQCMAVSASAFNFQWSRWNLLSGREKMIFQMRERHGTASPGNYQMVLNTPRKCVRIDCTETSPNYTETQMEEFEYQVDLLNLVRRVGTSEALSILANTNPHHVEAVRIMLTSIRPLTFS